jgi:hypothetical protein
MRGGRRPSGGMDEYLRLQTLATPPEAIERLKAILGSK